MSGAPQRLAPVLWLLLGLFVLRVTGQILVAFGGVSWLPSMEAWMSGWMPYPWLLPSQIAIIVLYGAICVDFTRGTGFFVRPSRFLARGVLGFGIVYFAAMALRLAVFGLSIPVVFHFVLAGFLILVGRWHRERLARR